MKSPPGIARNTRPSSLEITARYRAKHAGMPGLQPPSNLLWRPLARQLSCNQFAQGRVECQLAGLGPAGAIQRSFISSRGSIGLATAIPANFAADRGRCSPQMSAKPRKRAPRNETARYLLALCQAERARFARPGYWRKSTLRRDNAKDRSRVLAEGPPDITQRFAGLPTSPEFRLLIRRQAWATGSCHRSSFQSSPN
jgi:hypothetical protein